MVLVAWALAFSWLAGLAVLCHAAGGFSLLERYPPEYLAAAGIGVLIPAAMLVMAGYMARTGRRSAAANALVLEAASRLMAPAREAGAEGAVFAEQMKSSATEIERAMRQALAAMKELASEVGDERARLESVSLAAADNTRDLSARLTDERRALETLARDLRQQLSVMNDMMVRQAQLMVSAARAAGEEASRAETALADRVREIDRAGADLGHRLETLDGIAGEAAGRAASFAALIGQLEVRLVQAQRSVDAAVKASETALAAAGSTAQALRQAVSAARDIAPQEPAGPVVADQSGGSLLPLQAPADRPGAGPGEAPPALARETVNGSAPPADGNAAPVPGATGAAEKVMIKGRAANGSGLSRSGLDDDLFEASAEAVIAASLAGAVDAPDPGSGPERLSAFPVFAPGEGAPASQKDGFDQLAGPAPRRRATDFPDNLRDLSGSAAGAPAWREIISEISRDEERPASDRESVAEAVVERLQSSGIPLADIFRPKSKRRIAQASERSPEDRHAASIEQGGKQYDRVVQRLRGDPRLMDMARQFVRYEREDALAALEQTQSTGRNASPRLAAFLLLEAAL